MPESEAGGGDCSEPGDTAEGVARGMPPPPPPPEAAAGGRATGVGSPPAGGLMKGAPEAEVAAGEAPVPEEEAGGRLAAGGDMRPPPLLPLPPPLPLPPSMLRRLRRAASEAGRLLASNVNVGVARRPPLPLRAGLGPPRCSGWSGWVRQDEGLVRKELIDLIWSAERRRGISVLKCTPWPWRRRACWPPRCCSPRCWCCGCGCAC